MEENKKKSLKHTVLEVLEGGLSGSFGARLFSWAAFILILWSNTFMVLSWIEEPGEKTELIFEIVEAATIALFTAEVVLGCWTADIRFQNDPHPRRTFFRQPMTVIAVLAILPFYLGLILRDSRFNTVTDVMRVLALLHLAKAWEIMHSVPEKE